MNREIPQPLKTDTDRPAGSNLWSQYLIVLAAVGFLYTLTVAPGALWQDNGMAQVRVLERDYVGKLGLALAHPLYYLMARAFQILPFSESAYKTNLVAAFFGILTVANMYLLFNRLFSASPHGRSAAIVATISLAVAHTFWQHCALAEVYTVSAFILTCELLALVKFTRTGHIGWWLLVAFLNGLECSNHVLALITLFAFAVWSVFLIVSGSLKPVWILPAVGLWILGCLPYEYLGYRAWAEGQPLVSVIHSMLFGKYQSAVLNVRFGLHMILASVLIIGLNFPTPNLLLVPFGVATARRVMSAPLFNFFALVTILHFAFALRYPVRDQYTFFIIPVLFLSIWLGFGVLWALDFWSLRIFKPVIVLALIPIGVYLALPALVHRFYPTFAYPPVPYRDAASFFFWPWKTGYRGADRFARETFETVGPRDLILADDTSARPLHYYQLTRNLRPAVKIDSDLYGNQPQAEKINRLIRELSNRHAWIVRPYPGYTPPWILDHFQIVPQSPLYRIVGPKVPSTNISTTQRSSAMPSSEHKWISATDERFTVNGLPWFAANGRKFFRLPLDAEKKVTLGVWTLAANPSGGRIRFKTDSSCLKLKIHHGGGSIDMPHFCAVGCSGIDLYEGPPKKSAYWLSNRPGDVQNPYICNYVDKLPRKMREFTLYLPTYCNLASLEIGLDRDARITPPSPFRLKKPVVFYGTSITQGGCASRGGNGYVPLLGRMLGVDVVNLGFSGSGKCEPEMADLLGEIDAAAYVLDPLPNMSPALMTERYGNFVDRLRSRRPDRPLILANCIHYASDLFTAAPRGKGMNEVVRDVFARRVKQKDTNIFFFDAAKAIPLGANHPSVDGCHLTDLGYQIFADALAPILAKSLGLK